MSIQPRDVHSHLTNQALRDTMDAGVRSAFASNTESIVVAHSLGTVVVYNVLRHSPDANSLNVPLFVTLGSPLAVNVVKKAIRPTVHPTYAARWFNAIDERDVVALFPLNSSYFDVDPSIENKTDVDNPTQNRHGILGYLIDPEVAKTIYIAFTA